MQHLAAVFIPHATKAMSFPAALVVVRKFTFS